MIGMLLTRIEKDFHEALQNKQTERLSVLRLLKAALQNKEIDLRPKKEELTDEIIISIIQGEGKKRKEAIELYTKGGRIDLADKEKKELEILYGYLPEQLSDDKIREIVDKVIADIGATGPQDFGKVMGPVMKEVKGMADGNKIGSIVREKLTGGHESQK